MQRLALHVRHVIDQAALQAVTLLSRATGLGRLQAVEAAAEVFASVLLPDRKLRTWGERDASQLPAGRTGQRTALFWAFEDALKDRCAWAL